MVEYSDENNDDGIADRKDNFKIKICVKISGRVQGVWYRGWTVDEAKARDVEGWIANRPDGSVEALFAGKKYSVQDMLSVCRKGPALANVTSISEINYNENTMPAFRLGVFYNAGSY
ncbi:MAG: acylphosphatase [Alphaproteobacteria bacterium]|nr:acylphosphatase [Alphaproteobacteria bacterium]